MATFKERIKHLRLLAEYSQQDLADRLKVSKQTISQYERGVREPDYDNLLALCDIFNVSTDYLLGISDRTVRFLSTDDLEAAASVKPLRPDESTLLDNYNALNQVGKDKVQEYVEDLADNEKYIKDIELFTDAV